MKKLVLILSVIALFSCQQQLLITDKYSRSEEGILSYGNSPERNFYYPTNLGDSLKQLWEDDYYGGVGNSSVVAQNGFMFFADMGGRVSIIDIETGKKIGHVSYKGEIVTTPVISNRRIIFGVNDEDSPNSTVIFYDFIEGKKSKEIIVKGIISNEFIRHPDGLFILLQNGTLVRLEYFGSKNYELDLGEDVYSDPASYQDKILFGDRIGNLVSVNLDGSINYKKRVATGFESGLTINDDKYYIGDIDGNLICGNPGSGAILWQFKAKSKIVITPILDIRNLYFGDLGGNYYCLDKESGNLIWEIKIDGLFNSTGIVFDDFIVQPDYSGKILIINKLSGNITKTIRHDNRVSLSPIFYNNKLIYNSYRGVLHVMERVHE
ncbi:MAG: PQQ-binding-like beta-propeller repeat protein [Melioribacteraceae bacterium]|nr:PQQ-binding-like beta-propeller repeat protein [Melioribacteraceae bacterium]MCF8264583.1 PQQ-binding-like beta-propeller repeat protein [Melioribacteraceae bacterium]MCF8412322.1 PQQ-binding-like beta-propeller repeat protein [Melioribacteraceae bacterium]